MALEVKIKKKLGNFKLDVAFDTQTGCMGILGASGCGKSMALKCIAGIEKPDEGRIVLNGNVLFDSEKNINLPTQKRRVGYLFQDYALFPMMTVEQNIRMGMAGTKQEKTLQMREEICRFHLQGLERHYPSQLSGGQKQRVALARMLANAPELIMLDEPFSALDAFLKDRLKLELSECLKKYDRDVLLVSHNRDEIYQFCDRMTILDHGKGIMSGITEQIFRNPYRLEAARLTGCKNISRANKTGEFEVFAQDWNIVLNTMEPVADGVAYVGIRAHHLIPAEDGMGENTMKVSKAGYTEAPFKKQFLFQNAEPGDQTDIRLWWLVNQTAIVSDHYIELPPYMTFPKEALLLLL